MFVLLELGTGVLTALMSAPLAWLYVVSLILIFLVPTVGLRTFQYQDAKQQRRNMGLFPSKNHFPVDGRVSPH